MYVYEDRQRKDNATVFERETKNDRGIAVKCWLLKYSHKLLPLIYFLNVQEFSLVSNLAYYSR